MMQQQQQHCANNGKFSIFSCCAALLCTLCGRGIWLPTRARTLSGMILLECSGRRFVAGALQTVRPSARENRSPPASTSHRLVVLATHLLPANKYKHQNSPLDVNCRSKCMRSLVNFGVGKSAQHTEQQDLCAQTLT